MADLRIIDGGLTTATVDSTTRKRRKNDGIWECPKCRGREYLTTAIGECVIEGRLVSKGLRFKRCVLCLSQGKLTEMRKLPI